MKNLLLAILMLLLFTNMQCNKSTTPPEPPTTQPDGLPLETQEGKNTFGCFWNDTLWLPNGGTIPAINCSFNSDSNWINIVFRNEDKKETLAFNLVIPQIGYYELTSKYPFKIEVYKSLTNYKIYKCSEPNSLKINITKFIKPNRITTPKTKGIISGTFTLKLFKQNSNGIDMDISDSIVIKKAVFDLQLN